MNRKIAILAAFLGLTGIILGAFGAHALKELVDTASVNSFETGTRYQLVHALFLLFLADTQLLHEKTKKVLWILVGTGVVLFSGSIYALATNALSSFDFRAIALLTPLGGTLLIFAWGVLLISLIRRQKT